MTRYLARKSLLYLLTFWFAVTIDWMIPRLMPGDPDRRADRQDPGRLDRVAGAPRLLHQVVRARPTAVEAVPELLARARPGRPRAEHHLCRIDRQRAELGRRSPTPSRCSSPRSSSATSQATASARWPPAASLDNTVLPAAYVLTAMPYMWLAIVLVYVVSFHWELLPSPAPTTSRSSPPGAGEFASLSPTGSCRS